MPERTTFEELLTVGEVAEALRYTEGTVRHWIRTGKLPAIQVTGGVFDDPAMARRAVDALQASPLRLHDVSIVAPTDDRASATHSGEDVSAGQGAAVPRRAAGSVSPGRGRPASSGPGDRRRHTAGRSTSSRAPRTAIVM